MLGEDDQFVVTEPRIAEHLAKLFELGLIRSRDPAPRHVEERVHLEKLRLQLAEAGRNRSTQGTVLERLVAFAVAVGPGILVGRPRLELVVEIVEPALRPHELFFGVPPLPDLGDQSLELLLAPFKRAHKGIGRAGEAPLEHAHRQACGGSVQHPAPGCNSSGCSRWWRRRVPARLPDPAIVRSSGCRSSAVGIGEWNRSGPSPPWSAG